MALSTVVSRKAMAARYPTIQKNPSPAIAMHARKVACRSQLMSTLAAVGDVNAPIEVVVGAAIVVSLAATALIPIALNPGQQAANKIFTATVKAPLDKKAIDKKPAAGKKSKK